MGGSLCHNSLRCNRLDALSTQPQRSPPSLFPVSLVNRCSISISLIAHTMLLNLRKHIDAQETGSLSTVDAFGIPIVIYLLQGTIVAAHAGDDTHAVLRILLKREFR